MKDMIISFVPRLLSMLDRNKNYPTYGCFDRMYWHYKGTDFPSAIYQQAVLVLALLYKNKFSNNIYYKNSTILDYIIAGMLFWSKIQNKDGSFSEWYPNERSFVATAFTAYAVSEAYLMLKNEAYINDDTKLIIEHSLQKAGEWLVRKNDEMVLNHTAGSVACLHNIYLITKDAKFKEATDEKINFMSKHQHQEGWFYEYGGADIGYLSVSIDYLAKYFEKTKDLHVKGILEKALNFMVFFIHPDGTAGGEYGSRNTKYILPHGLTILSDSFETARYILGRFYIAFNKGITINPSTVDDRYFIFFYMPNFLQAVLKNYDFFQQENKNTNFLNFRKIFSHSGLVTVKNEKFHVVLNFKKGGVMKVFNVKKDNSQLIYSDSGYFGKLKNGKIFTSAWLNPDTLFFLDEEKELKIKINTEFAYVSYNIFSTGKFILFRLYNYILGSNNRVSGLFDKWLKKNIMIKKKKAPLKLEREIAIKEDGVFILDKINKIESSGDCQYLNISKSITGTLGPTSLFFVPADLAGNYLVDFDFSEILNTNNNFNLDVNLIFKDDLCVIKSKLNGNDILPDDKV